MSSALTVIVLGHAFFGPIPNSFPTVPTSILVPNITGLLNESTTTPSHTPDHKIKRPDYTYIPGIGSHKVHKQAKTWDDARLICQEEGGDLAVINSKAEAIIVGQLVAISQPHIDSEYEDLAFIGFSDRYQGEGQYRTMEGQRLKEAGYEEWAEGEPNNGGDNTWVEDDCGAIAISGLLFDANCVRHYAFVCELPGPAVESMAAIERLEN